MTECADLALRIVDSSSLDEDDALSFLRSRPLFGCGFEERGVRFRERMFVVLCALVSIKPGDDNGEALM